ncbi:ABC transporter ATP-binding protein [Conservatibacter flavescens]|uniref:sn-glycerol-3-phosphate ABC transporter ATP-binding protein UgpC n=1 Tax=Conservatibacter flavescens TaxID=28161 RepID=A0A2M8S4F9_9PAST|nr:sn-glycerol-3-phosphate ABC transporter ATP-binding protein UgpC [Conservatibacter flavescens]PJG86027.1 sn-glycerol-3-phosphate ABC transporter ATP-binding protein UgpC [Conservatibacter flavescens]
MATLTLNNITKHYGSAKKPGELILKGIDIDVQDGEFIVVVGPSGCGKSTLLRIIAGLETSSGGEIYIGGDNVTALEPSQRNIAMVFQNYALYPHMSVRENMAYGIRLAKMPADEIERRITDAAKMLELEPHLDKKPKQLSGGQRQRVAMGRAIVRQPKLFLFDEPLSNLDAKLRTSTRLEIRRRHNQIGTTTLYVTHDQTEAMTLADRIIVMNKGHIEQFDTPENIFSRPASTFVANFIGLPAMNLLQVRVQDSHIYCGQQLLRHIPIPETIQKSGKKEWILGIRPEHIRVLDEPSDDAWYMNVTISELLGSEQLIYGDIDQQGIILRQSDIRQNLLHTAKRSNLYVQPDLTQLHWFDTDNQLRVE